MTQNNKIIMSNIMLIIASFIWGSNFVFQKIVATEIGPFTFMSARSFLGAITILIIIWFLNKKKKKTDIKEGEVKVEKLIYDREYFKKLIPVAALCGCVNVSGSVLVQLGLIYTTASKAGFLNAIYIIFVPIIGLIFFKKKTSILTLIGIILSIIGLYNLCAKGNVMLEFGDAVILASTLCFALHIQLMSKYVNIFNGIHLSFIEFTCASIYCAIAAFIFENPSVAQLINCSYSILFAGVLGIGVCYALQVTAQKYTDPTVAALLMSLESVFGALGGVLVLGESFTMREFVGVLFIIAAIILAQVPIDKVLRRNK